MKKLVLEEIKKIKNVGVDDNKTESKSDDLEEELT